MFVVPFYRIKTENGMTITPIKRDNYEDIIYKVYDEDGVAVINDPRKTDQISIQSESAEETIQADEGTELNVDVSEDSISEEITEIIN